jgi:hypothetical protein
VAIANSSGFASLDEAARRQVAGRFRFKVGDARILLVPIEFQL